MQRSAERDQHPPETEQESGRGQRFDELDRHVSGIAEARAASARLGAIHDDDATTFARECIRNAGSDDTCANHCNRILLRHSANVYDEYQ